MNTPEMKLRAINAVLAFAPYMKAHAKRLRVSEPSIGRDDIARIHVDSINRRCPTVSR